MAQPAIHIARTRAAIGRLTEAFEQAIACLQEYEWLETAPGTVASHFFESDGTTPRADLDLTAEQYAAAIAALNALRSTVNSGSIGVDLYRVKG